MSSKPIQFFTMEVTVLGVQKWTVDNNGTSISGISVHYFDPANHETDPDRIGVFPASITADNKLFSKFTSLPAKYNLSLGLKRGSGGKAKPVLNDVFLIPKVEK